MKGTVRLAPITNRPAEVADLGRRLGLGADHEPRRVAQGQDGEVVGVAQLQESGCLVGAVAVDGARRGGPDRWPPRRGAGPRSGPVRSPCPAPNPARSSSTDSVSTRVVSSARMS